MDHKSFMGAAQILLDDLDLSNMVIGWFKLFPPSSLVDPTLAPLTRRASQASLDSGSGPFGRSQQFPEIQRYCSSHWVEFEICDRSRPPGNTACLMLCVQSLFLRGEKRRSCFCSQKKMPHKEQSLEGRDKTKLEDGLLSLRNVTIPAFRIYLKPLEMSLN